MSETSATTSAGGPNQRVVAQARPPISPEQWWQERKAKVEEEARAGEPNATLAIRLAEELSEKNLPAVYQIICIFGRERTEETAKQALALFSEAAPTVEPKSLPPNAPSDTPPTSTATHRADGKRRSAGGIFFNLMRRYSNSLRLDWQSLRIPMLPEAAIPKSKSQNRPSAQNYKSKGQEAKVPTTATTPNRPPTEHARVNTVKGVTAAKSGEDPAKSSVPAPASSSPQPAAKPDKTTTTSPTTAKATRLKATVIGELIGQPRPNPQGQAGLIELAFRSEISPAMPKGLPNSGTTEVKVWCNEKQWRKVSQDLQPDDRFIIEGEVLAGVNKELVPFVRLLAIRVTTTRLEQAVREKQSTDKS